MTTKTYISVAQAAALSGVTPVWIRKLCQSGQMDAKKLAREWLVNEAAARKLGRKIPGVGQPRKSRNNIV